MQLESARTMYRQASVLADSAAARPSYHVVSGLVVARKSSAPSAQAKARKSQPATNLKTTRGSQGERTAEGRDD
jgi:hypothetical protein